MRVSFFWIIGMLLSNNIFSQGGGQQVPPQNQLPDFFSPSPEATAILKANLINIGYSTGSPNINIPLFNFQTGSYNLPITLNYSSTGIKVDEYASMVGMGWTLNYGGVISRTVMDQPDENRDPNNCNLISLNFQNPGAAELNFLRNAHDKQSDIFTFSFPGYSGKFIMDLNWQPVQLTKNNLKIESINNFSQNGFRIITDDGTEYLFQADEVTQGMNPTGSNCQKTYENQSIKTSWYLTKIILPSRQKWIEFSYITVNNIKYQSSITQTISMSVYTQQYQCTPNQCPLCCSGLHGDACPVGSGTFSTCISQQKVNSKFISKIENNDGDKIEFFYDAGTRQDLENGKRLSTFKVTNRNGNVLRHLIFNGSYQNTINPVYHSGGDIYANYRLFLESVIIRNGANSSSNQLVYSFNYDSYNTLPPRLSFAQDFYGYYNGKLSNPSLIPVLQSNDINYTVFTLNGNPGTGSSLVTFGDRSIDPNYSKRGLLNKITYPTGGYDIISYSPNYTIKLINSAETEVLAGGHSVSNISSYTCIGQKVIEREFKYRNFSDNKLSSFLLTKNLNFSQRNTLNKDGYLCQSGEQVTCIAYDIGPECTFAVVTSNTNNPITAFGGQHIYFRSVQEITKGTGSADNGMTEHMYSYFSGGQLTPRHWLGNYILNAPFQIVPDILIGETYTDFYKNIAQPNNPPLYQLSKRIERHFGIYDLNHYSNYIVRKNYEPLNQSGYPNPSMMAAFDVEETYINTYTVRLNYTLETEYDDNGLPTLSKTTFVDYENMSYTYPRRIRTTESDGLESKVERKYPSDPEYNFQPYTGMTARNIISPIIEEKYFKNDVLQTTRTQSFTDVFSNTNLYAPQIVDLQIGSSSYSQKIKYHLYDIYGNVKEISKHDDNSYTDQHIVYIWDYKDNYPVAKIQNALNNNHVAYTSFEADGKGNWNFTGPAILAPEEWAPTGKKYYDLSNGSITKSGLNPSLNYYVSYWSKTGSKAVSNSVSVFAGRSVNNWVYFEHKVANPSGGTVSVSGTGAIDELRLYPEGALMTTMTYEPLIGITSQCDPNNRINYYIYDDFNRLALILDQDYHVVKKICYNYHNQPEDCTTPCYNRFPDWQNTGAPTCQQNSCGNTGYQLQTQQDMNPCSPTYNQTQVLTVYNPTACTPATGVYITYNVMSFASGFTAVFTNNANPAEQYTFPVPTGTGTLGCIPAGIYSLSISKPGNMGYLYFGNGCHYVTGTSAFFGKVNVSICNEISISYVIE